VTARVDRLRPWLVPPPPRFCLIVARLKRFLADAPEASSFPEAESGVLTSDSGPAALRRMGTSGGEGKLQPLFATRRNILKRRWCSISPEYPQRLPALALRPGLFWIEGPVR
jgi:hypothetical protein